MSNKTDIVEPEVLPDSLKDMLGMLDIKSDTTTEIPLVKEFWDNSPIGKDELQDYMDYENDYVRKVAQGVVGLIQDEDNLTVNVELPTNKLTINKDNGITVGVVTEESKKDLLKHIK